MQPFVWVDNLPPLAAVIYTPPLKKHPKMNIAARVISANLGVAASAHKLVLGGVAQLAPAYRLICGGGSFNPGVQRLPPNYGHGYERRKNSRRAQVFGAFYGYIFF